MEMNKALNVSCDFDGYLVCQIPNSTVEVELKIKTTKVKYALIKDALTRTERYHPWDRANRRAQIHAKRLEEKLLVKILWLIIQPVQKQIYLMVKD